MNFRKPHNKLLFIAMILAYLAGLACTRRFDSLEDSIDSEYCCQAPPCEPCSGCNACMGCCCACRPGGQCGLCLSPENMWDPDRNETVIPKRTYMIRILLKECLKFTKDDSSIKCEVVVPLIMKHLLGNWNQSNHPFKLAFHCNIAVLQQCCGGPSIQHSDCLYCLGDMWYTCATCFLK